MGPLRRIARLRWRTPRATILLGLVAGGAIAAGGAAALGGQGSPACPSPPAPVVVTVPPPRMLAPEPPPLPPPEPEPPPPIERGACELDLLPPAMVQTLTPSEEAELDALVRAWIAGDLAPPIAHRRGAVHVESEEHREEAPPSPAEAARACGRAASWLRSHTRERLAEHADELTCQDNVCCFGGLEDSPRRLVVFRRDRAWSLDAAIVLHDGGMSEEVVDANVRHVKGALRRLARTSCPGAPAGAD